MRGLVAAGPDQPLWWTLRRPFRQLSYHAALRMFTRAGEALGKDWTLHDLRHTAAYQFQPRHEPAAIAALLGHRSLGMTLRYAKIASRTVADEYFAVTEKVEALYGQDQAS
jgi:integrase